jgi:hypothetical protein
MTDIYTTISAGSKGTGMAAFDFLMPMDRMALVHTVRSFGAFDHGSEDPKAVAELANQFRSKGFHIPNHIPVSLAIEKIVQEQAALAPLRLPAADDQSPAADLVRSAVADPARVARTVAGSGGRSEPLALARAWAAGAPGNGFVPAAATLSSEEWSIVVQALLGSDQRAPVPARKEDQQP